MHGERMVDRCSARHLDRGALMKEQMDDFYTQLSPDQIPWENEVPLAALVELVESGLVSPCRAVDLGCGPGNFAIYLAKQGFDVTGIDISSAAIQQARRNARAASVRCSFIAADLVTNSDVVAKFRDNIAFAHDWEILHHYFPEQREQYVQNVHALLKADGKYLSACFNEQDLQFGGVGKIRETSIGTRLYFSSEDEMRALFSPWFTIMDLKTV